MLAILAVINAFFQFAYTVAVYGYGDGVFELSTLLLTVLLSFLPSILLLILSLRIVFRKSGLDLWEGIIAFLLTLPAFIFSLWFFINDQFINDLSSNSLKSLVYGLPLAVLIIGELTVLVTGVILTIKRKRIVN